MLANHGLMRLALLPGISTPGCSCLLVVLFPSSTSSESCCFTSLQSTESAVYCYWTLTQRCVLQDHSLRLWNLESQVCVCSMVGGSAHTNEVLSVVRLL